ncbi:helix-turn-helix domain-containing protein [Robbsia sp. KACC 23696]|uniref:helix-turn-helix domain-containing protein n=1 Tax=Robbsia sp. KACC 23696 TaxID=3149231 RepID=UPI00325A6EB2
MPPPGQIAFPLPVIFHRSRIRGSRSLLNYLLHWRMQIACTLLEKTRRNVAEVAHEVRYESESAFSAAFNKVLGIRPGQYHRSLSDINA